MAYHKSARIIQKSVYAWTDNIPVKIFSWQKPTRRHQPKVDCLTNFVGMPLKNIYSAVTTFCWRATSHRKIEFLSYAKSLLVFGQN